MNLFGMRLENSSSTPPTFPILAWFSDIPTERSTISSMLAGILLTPPNVGVRSELSIGIQGPTVGSGPPPDTNTITSKVSLIVTMLALGVQFPSLRPPQHTPV